MQLRINRTAGAPESQLKNDHNENHLKIFYPPPYERTGITNKPRRSSLKDL